MAAGALLLQTGGGLRAQFGELPTATLADTALIVEPAKLTVLAHNGARALRDRLVLWGPPPGASQAVPEPVRRQSEIDLAAAPGALVFAISEPGSETVIVAATGSANLDRPLAVDGSRLPLAYAPVLPVFSILARSASASC